MNAFLKKCTAKSPKHINICPLFEIMMSNC
ncbi:MAG: hypothetical protein E7020_06790 [Alphaproteobacteria bacterium]|nr:hypothetical protein [Alphaproteobacteria bacterium]